MSDPTELLRRRMIETRQPYSDLEIDTGIKWTPADLANEFEVMAFMAPFVIVKRKADGKMGSLMFTHSPRVYFNWQADERG